MGHERLGLLPKTKRWRAIVAEIAAMDAPPSDVPEIARRTLDALGSRYLGLASDKSVETAFAFLVDVSRAAAGKTESVELTGRSPLGLAADLANRLGTIKLTRGLSNSFSQPVEVTIPYDASTVGADDYPVVFYPG